MVAWGTKIPKNLIKPFKIYSMNITKHLYRKQYFLDYRFTCNWKIEFAVFFIWNGTKLKSFQNAWWWLQQTFFKKKSLTRIFLKFILNIQPIELLFLLFLFKITVLNSISHVKAMAVTLPKDFSNMILDW